MVISQTAPLHRHRQLIPHPHPHHHHGPWRRLLNPLLDPYLNGAFAAPWEAWEPLSACLANGIWVFVIIMVLFMIVFGGPRY
jgi:hypothetical protein